MWRRMLLALSLLSTGCEVTQRTDPGGDIVALRIVPDQVATAASQRVRFRALGRTAVGDTSVVAVTWSATGGTIDAAGVFVAGATAGAFAVSATLASPALSVTAQVQHRGTLRQVILVPDSATLPPGGAVRFAAYGFAIGGDSVFVSPTFSATGGTIDADGGYTAGQTPGSYHVIATAAVNPTGATTADTAPVTIATGAPAPVASVDVTPDSAAILVDATVQLTATPRDAAGNPLAGRAVDWSSADETVATVDATGLVTGVAPGAATVTATAEGQHGSARITVAAPPETSHVFVGAGDIADCGNDNDETTAQLLDGIAGTVFTTGDNVYSSGTAAQFQDCYAPTWGRHRERTRPSPGNHDYNTAGAAGYYAYFGELAGPAGRGYYSFDLGAWHIVSLNSEIAMSAGSEQEAWLRADLAASAKQCTLAYWHKPRFSSGTNHGNEDAAEPLWQALYDFGAELVLGGHEHNYERFAPQTPTGVADSANGIREFVVGTGGKGHYTGVSPLPTSEVFDATSFGVLQLTLGPGTYTWEFIPVAGASFSDSGSGTCH